VYVKKYSFLLPLCDKIKKRKEQEKIRRERQAENFSAAEREFPAE